jgi:hypothetical protein
MIEFLNNLLVNEILFTTNRGTTYRFIKMSNDGGVVYSINSSRKTLPLRTILQALNDYRNGEMIDRAWYRNYNEIELRNRGCNVGVLINLIERFNSHDE